ncbi:MAG: DUF411 domain-containing protein [Acidobacteriota bacterium]
MTKLSRRAMLSTLVAAAVAPRAFAQPPQKMDVFKSPTCGCCEKWVSHVRASGFAPTATDVDDMTVVKTQRHVPPALQSCHTAIVAGYVIEGHVPAEDIKRLLKERPAIAGLAVPGMPSGSPGMEGAAPRPYDVVAFDKQGKTRVFATHGR